MALALLALPGGCERHGDVVTLSGDTMGTTWHVTYVPVPEGVLEERARVQIEAVLAEVNASMSTYDPGSEISAINRQAVESAVEARVSPAFADVLVAALEVHAAAGGSYDVTVGPLVELWGFGAAERRDRVPPPAAIERARAVVGLDRIAWEPATRTLTMPQGMSLDFSSLAKGYAVDRVVAALADLGLSQVLVEIGGEVRALGASPRGDHWRIGVERPGLLPTAPIEAVELLAEAVATSGDYRNYFEVGGRRYSHMIDPLTGYPVEHDLVSVTVVAPSCMVADAWATALAVAGTGQAKILAERYNLAVYLLSRQPGSESLTSYRSRAFELRTVAGEGDFPES